MGNKILVLDPQIANKIAAGEVVEKPASVIKELIENSIDANSKNITVEIKNGGKDYIRISDDGIGINPEDVLTAFMRHSTSKIEKLDDIYNINSLGFRGEALASISSVSNVEIISKTIDFEFGKKVIISGGNVIRNENVGAQNGTTIIVKDLFFNTPARLKFLKSNSSEQNSISNIVNKLALSNLDISFKYIVNDKMVFKTRGNGILQDILYDIYGKSIPENMVKYEGAEGKIRVEGLISPLEFTRGNRQMQLVYVNGRYINSDIISETIALSYKGILPINRFPICFIFLTVPTDSVDVNIHPSKTEIKFHEEGKIKQLLYATMRKTLNSVNQVPAHAFVVKEEYGELPRELTTEPSKKIIIEQPKAEFKVIAKPEVNIFSKPSYKPEKVSELKYDLKDLFVKEVPKEIQIKEVEKIVSSSIYDDLIYIGQIFKTYLIFEKNDQMYLVDQHAAHEKVLYEEFMYKYSIRKIDGQILMDPIIIDLSYNDKDLILSNVDWINKLGFLVESFGDSSIIIREIPYIFDRPASKAFVEEFIDNTIRNKKLIDYKEDSIIMDSCKAAIKANMRISDIEVYSLIKNLKTLKDPYTCPHGRPIIVSTSKYEIEKKFKRI